MLVDGLFFFCSFLNSTLMLPNSSVHKKFRATVQSCIYKASLRDNFDYLSFLPDELRIELCAL